MAKDKHCQNHKDESRDEPFLLGRRRVPGSDHAVVAVLDGLVLALARVVLIASHGCRFLSYQCFYNTVVSISSRPSRNDRIFWI